MSHKIVVDLGFGDAGKGTVVDYLCATGDVRAVIRFSGGAQAAHNVVLPDGTHHTFAQFGSGTLQGAMTFLSRFTLVNPFSMAREADRLLDISGIDPFIKTYIDGGALMVTPYHVAANRKRETARGHNRHGSCGQGIGETQSYAIDFPDEAPRMRDLEEPGLLKHKLKLLRQRLTEELGRLEAPTLESLTEGYAAFLAERRPIMCESRMLKHFLDMGDCVFEGSQGVLLDEWYGFHPYTTWSTTTFENAETLLRECGHSGAKVGVTRSYMTRHGAGPLPTELPTSSSTSHAFDWYRERHNDTGVYQGAWRVGNLDLTLLDYAVRVCGGVDQLAVTHMDRVGAPVAMAYGGNDLLGVKTRKTDLARQERLAKLLSSPQLISKLDFAPASSPDRLISLLEARLDAPVTLTSYGPTWADKRVLDRALTS